MKKAILSSFMLLFIISCTTEIHDVESKSLKNDLFDTEFVDFTTFKNALTENEIQLQDEEQILALIQSEFTARNSQIYSFQVSKELEGISIIASNESKEQKTSIWLKSQTNEVAGYRIIGSVCTCSGCSDGCNPKRKGNGDCYCTESANDRNCTKSETINGRN